MTGIRVGSRLEQLQRLADQVAQEIAQERHRIALEARQHPPTWKAYEKPARAANPAGDRCIELGVAPLDVKKWAVAKGLIPAVVRGRLALWIVEAYAEAHP